MTNSSWTQRHISSLWGLSRTRRGKQHDIGVVYPPCAVEELQQSIPVDSPRSDALLYIAQFRPEKMHETIIDAFTALLKKWTPEQGPKPKLILAGSVRDDGDEKRVYKLRLQAQEVREHVEFVVNAKWQQILDLLRSSSIGVNGMWNEHFGIGCVEYQAAGLISVVNKSGGPKEDIVVSIDGLPTGTSGSAGVCHYLASHADLISQDFWPPRQLSLLKASRKHYRCLLRMRWRCAIVLARALCAFQRKCSVPHGRSS